MERSTRFDVADYNGVRMVVVESDLLPPDSSLVVILLLATRLIAAVQRTRVRRVGSVADQGDRIIRAVDILMAGV